LRFARRPSHQAIPPRSIAVVVPARVIGEVSDKNRDMTHWAKELYIDLAHRYPKGLKEITECGMGNAECGIRNVPPSRTRE